MEEKREMSNQRLKAGVRRIRERKAFISCFVCGFNDCSDVYVKDSFTENGRTVFRKDIRDRVICFYC